MSKYIFLFVINFIGLISFSNCDKNLKQKITNDNNYIRKNSGKKFFENFKPKTEHQKKLEKDLKETLKDLKFYANKVTTAIESKLQRDQKNKNALIAIQKSAKKISKKDILDTLKTISYEFWLKTDRNELLKIKEILSRNINLIIPYLSEMFKKFNLAVKIYKQVNSKSEIEKVEFIPKNTDYKAKNTGISIGKKAFLFAKRNFTKKNVSKYFFNLFKKIYYKKTPKTLYELNILKLYIDVALDKIVPENSIHTLKSIRLDIEKLKEERKILIKKNKDIKIIDKEIKDLTTIINESEKIQVNNDLENNEKQNLSISNNLLYILENIKVSSILSYKKNFEEITNIENIKKWKYYDYLKNIVKQYNVVINIYNEENK